MDEVPSYRFLSLALCLVGFPFPGLAFAILPVALLGAPVLGAAALGGGIPNPAFSQVLEHDLQKWIPVFGKRSCSKRKLERDDEHCQQRACVARLPANRPDGPTQRYAGKGERLPTEQ